MNEWVELRCEAIRLALRILSFPQEADLYRLVDWLRGCIILEWAEIEQGRCVHRPDRRAVITLPARRMGRVVDEQLAHEVGHALLTAGMGSLLRQLSDEERMHALADTWTAQDEARAREFVAAWYLPSALVAEWPDDDELAHHSGCTFEMVRARRASLQGRVVQLQEPAPWAAAQQYHVVTQMATRSPLVYVVRHGSIEPVYSIPVNGPEEAEEIAYQVTADLVALTITEFELAYEDLECASPAPVRVDLDILRRWARL